MIFIGGVSPRVKPSGNAACSCPACHKDTTLFACKKETVFSLFFIPIIPFHTSYILTCPICASVMGLDKEKGRNLERNPHMRLFPEDLTILQNNAGTLCPHCGGPVSGGQNFCPACGQRL